MKIIKYMFSVAGAFLFVGCQQHTNASTNRSPDEHAKTIHLNIQEAENDAHKALMDGNCKLYAVNGFSWSIPNDYIDIDTARRGFGIIFLDDTVDYARTDAEKTANRVGRSYATSYNNIVAKNCYKAQPSIPDTHSTP